MSLVATTFQISYSPIITSVSAVIADILTTSSTPQTHKQPVTVTFKLSIYTQISTTPIPLPPPTPTVSKPLPTQTQGVYMKLQIFTTVHM